MKSDEEKTETEEELHYKMLVAEAEIINSQSGNLNEDGYNCEKCNNRGFYVVVKNTDIGWYDFAVDCECLKVHNLIKSMYESGLGDMLKVYKFATYNHDLNWQNNIYNKAQNFVKCPTNCFYIGGQVGSGKTHICTAIVGEFMKKSETSVKYVVWEELSTLLKQEQFDDKESYNERLDTLRECKVLFIDDLFKTVPTIADIRNCFNIVNYRYNLSKSYADENYITIISSEKTINELLEIDEAIASRIYEMAKGYCLSIDRDSQKNYRFRRD